MKHQNTEDKKKKKLPKRKHFGQRSKTQNATEPLNSNKTTMEQSFQNSKGKLLSIHTAVPSQTIS